MNTERNNSGASTSRPPDPGRMLPQSAEAERGALASMLLSPHEVCAWCAERRIGADSFLVPAHATIFGAIMELWELRQPIDPISLHQALRDTQVLDGVGGANFLAELFQMLPTAANAKYYVGILEEKATLRRIIDVGTEYVSRAYGEPGDAAVLLDEFEARALAIGQRYGAHALRSAKELAFAAVESIERVFERRGAPSGLSTGFPALDRLTDGLHPAEFCVIAARPSMGKTALAMNMVDHLAVELRKPVGIFSLEMSAVQLMQRLICSRARVNLTALRNGLLTERDFPAMTSAAAALGDAKIFIDDESAQSIQAIRARARRWRSLHGIEAVFLDYLQLARSETRRAQENRQQEVSEISAGCKALAKELEIPVIVLAQLNRNPDHRAGDRRGLPRLSDLRDSGSVEQDADTVALLYRDEYYAETDDERREAEGRATLMLAKQRNGPVDNVYLTFLKEFTRFETRAMGDGDGG